MKKIFSKIHIHPFFYLFALLSIFTAHFSMFITVMLIIFVHECGHLFFTFLFHWNIKKIHILPFGGMIEFQEKLNKPIYQELFIVLGGPIFQIIFSKFYFTSYHYPLLFFNLLPIYPLDGSKIFFLLFNLFCSYYKSYFFLISTSFITILFCLSCFHNTLFLFVLIDLWIQNLSLLNKIKDLFLIFLFERYKEPFFFYRKKLIRGKNLKKMKRSVYHLFFYDFRFHDEKEELVKYFEK